MVSYFYAIAFFGTEDTLKMELNADSIKQQYRRNTINSWFHNGIQQSPDDWKQVFHSRVRIDSNPAFSPNASVACFLRGLTN